LIHRRNRFAFTDDSPDDGKKLCQPCYENNIDSRLITYDKDPAELICPYCNNIVSKKIARRISETQPLGYKEGVGKPQFEVAEKRRTRSRRNNHLTEPDFQVPKLGNFDDSELKQMVAEGGIILSIQDDNVESQQEEY